MKNFKIISLTIFFAANILVSCGNNSQKINSNPKDSTMITTEHFDFEEWKMRLETGTTSYTKEDGTKVNMSGTNEPSIVETLPPPSFLTKQKNYYKNGMLGRICFFIGGDVKVGIWRTYDDKGNLIKEVDEDKKFGKIKPEDILTFLDKEGYINIKTGEGRFDEGGAQKFSLWFVPSRMSTLSNEEDIVPKWYITIEPYFSNGYTQVDYAIDGNTGEVIEKKTEKILPIE